VATKEKIPQVQGEIETLLRYRHHLTTNEENDFAVYSSDQMLGIIHQITDIFTIFLGAIASISLIVGGVGIMNIMLVSITERTREIGIRKAVVLEDGYTRAVLAGSRRSQSYRGVIGIFAGWVFPRLFHRLISAAL